MARRRLLAAGAAAVVLVGAGCDLIARSNVTTGGGQSVGDDTVQVETAISADGRVVAFHSAAPDLVLGDTNGDLDVFVRDHSSGVTERVSVTGPGGQASGFAPAVSADGSIVAFLSTSSALGVAAGAEPEAFLRNRTGASTKAVSIGRRDPGNAAGWRGATALAVSGTGRWVSYVTSRPVAGGVERAVGVFDRLTDTTRILTVGASIEGTALSQDGRFVAYATSNPATAQTTVQVYDLTTDTADVVATATPAAGDPEFRAVGQVDLSNDGNVVAFAAVSSDGGAVPGVGAVGVYVVNRTTRALTFVPVGTDFELGALSADGRFVAYTQAGVVRRTNLATAGTQVVSLRSDGTNGTGAGSDVSGNGRFVSFASFDGGFRPEDTNARSDVFRRDMDPNAS